jgi:hypothetical protein
MSRCLTKPFGANDLYSLRPWVARTLLFSGPDPAGAYQSDSGEIWFDGHRVKISFFETVHQYLPAVSANVMSPLDRQAP